MSATVATIVTAGIAVLGTLLSPVLVQFITARTKAQEFELSRRQRQEEREVEARLDKYANLRASYTELNAEMRKFLRALSNYLHLISRRQCDATARAALDEARETYLRCYSDAQMRVSDEVLEAAARANEGLGRLYGTALRIDGLSISILRPGGAPNPTETDTLESAFSYLEEVRPMTWNMRNIMRAELGINNPLG
jgi:hypothetical protein